MQLAHTMIRILDLEKTLEFYTKFLGLKQVRRKKIGDEATLIFLTDDLGHYHIELTLNHGKTEYKRGDQFGHLAFSVENLETVIREVERRGWRYRSARPEVSSKYIFVKDPNGYDIEILERKSQ